MEKQYRSSIIKNHEITKKNFDRVSLKGYVALFLDFAQDIKKTLWEYSVTNDA